MFDGPEPLAARSKALVCGRSHAEIAGSNPTEGMDICLLCVLCVVKQRSLRQTDHSSRTVLPTVVRRYVWSRNLVNEEVMVHWRDVAPKKKKKQISVRRIVKDLCLNVPQTRRDVLHQIVSWLLQKKTAGSSVCQITKCHIPECSPPWEPGAHTENRVIEGGSCHYKADIELPDTL